jgi:penicillin-binding protein 1A
MPVVRKIVIIGLMFLVTALLIFFTILVFLLPSKDELLSLELKRPARLWSQEHWLIAEIGDERRYPLKIEQIPLLVQQAFIAVEDARFYKHSGVDFKSLLRAFFVDLSAKKKLQGGSTISMQVARNFFLSRQKTYLRKTQEILLALKMEYYLSKKQILELYLNKIFLGHRNFGIAAAAQFYFGKTVEELDIADIAILAGLPKAPSLLNPIASAERCLARRNYVLLKMLDHGFIDKKSFEAALQQPIMPVPLADKPLLHDQILIEFLKKELQESCPQALARGDDIMTTIQGSLQILAKKSLSEGLLTVLGEQKLPQSTTPQLETAGDDLPSFLEPCVVKENHDSKVIIELDSGSVRLLSPITEKISDEQFVERYEHAVAGRRFYFDHRYQRLLYLSAISGAIVILDKDGSLRALVGGPSWSDTFFNRATQAKRPIASTVKSLIFSQALDQGYDVTSLIEDAPYAINDSQGFVWRPHNHHGQYQGTISLENAFLRSSNLASVRLCQEISLTNLSKALSQTTKQSEQPLPLSFSLGSFECTPLELARLYSAFSNEGRYPLSTPFIMGEKASWDVLCSPESAYIIADLQKRFLQRLCPDKLFNCGGKTGTSNNFHDLWFAGYQNDLCCVVWIGFDQPRSTEMYAVKGAFPIWRRIALETSAVQKASNTKDFPKNIMLQKDRASGELKPIIIRS